VDSRKNLYPLRLLRRWPAGMIPVCAFCALLRQRSQLWPLRLLLHRLRPAGLTEQLLVRYHT
jgi:hypothetical protein